MTHNCDLESIEHAGFSNQILKKTWQRWEGVEKLWRDSKQDLLAITQALKVSEFNPPSEDLQEQH